jgi:acetamidase/formamidase
MRNLFVLILAYALVPGAEAVPWSGQNAARESGALSGRWLVIADSFGTPVYYWLKLDQQGEKLTGDFGGDKLGGTGSGNQIHFLAQDDQGGSEEGQASVEGATMNGKIIFLDSSNPGHPDTFTFSARRAPEQRARHPERHEFTPTTFYRQFSPLVKPVLTVSPGDTIHTTTVDAGGVDEHSITRVLGGNPETGPFLVETAMPGDTLIVHFTRLRLNRDWAGSDDFIVPRAVDNDLAVKLKDNGKNIRWHLDREHGVATPEKPSEHLGNYSVPLKPMLGCVAVAPPPAGAPPGTGDSGGYGGNMDFNEIVEGATVYLPVRAPGALLYIGDGHAAQGDGELNGNALETSMDVEFTVDLIPNKRIAGPRVESATHVMAVGLGGSLEEAMRAATSSMAGWLAEDYKLTPSEVAEVLGTAAEYKISEIADRNAGVVLKLAKQRLSGLAPAK